MKKANKILTIIFIVLVVITVIVMNWSNNQELIDILGKVAVTVGMVNLGLTAIRIFYYEI